MEASCNVVTKWLSLYTPAVRPSQLLGSSGLSLLLHMDASSRIALLFASSSDAELSLLCLLACSAHLTPSLSFPSTNIRLMRTLQAARIGAQHTLDQGYRLSGSTATALHPVICYSLYMLQVSRWLQSTSIQGVLRRWPVKLAGI